MTNRRRANRFALPRTGEATLRLMQDVLVESASPDTIVLLAEAPLRADESVILELPGSHGARAAVSVGVQSSAPVTIGDLRRHRLLVRVTPGIAAGSTSGPSGARDLMTLGRYLPAMGVLIRRVPVHVRDVSTSGCQLDSLEALPDGCVGLLELRDAAGLHTEAIRICRVARIPGSPWPWRAGAQFLSLSAPSEASVRNVVARFEIIDELQVRGRPSSR
jgi:hypothetical protein